MQIQGQYKVTVQCSQKPLLETVLAIEYQQHVLVEKQENKFMIKYSELEACYNEK